MHITHKLNIDYYPKIFPISNYKSKLFTQNRWFFIFFVVDNNQNSSCKFHKHRDAGGWTWTEDLIWLALLYWFLLFHVTVIYFYCLRSTHKSKTMIKFHRSLTYITGVKKKRSWIIGIFWIEFVACPYLFQ